MNRRPTCVIRFKLRPIAHAARRRTSILAPLDPRIRKLFESQLLMDHVVREMSESNRHNGPQRAKLSELYRGHSRAKLACSGVVQLVDTIPPSHTLSWASTRGMVMYCRKAGRTLAAP